MNTLNDKIKEAMELADRIIKDNPTITNIWFEFKNIKVSEIEHRAKEIGRDYDIVERDGKDVLRFQCHDRHNFNCTMFAYSVPVKMIKPEYILETEQV